MSVKYGIGFEGIDEVIAELERMGGDDLFAASENALLATHEIITPSARAAMQPHRRTGKTAKSLRATPSVNWNGTVASIELGFNLPKGLASIFLMYGTPRHAIVQPKRKRILDHPGVEADRALVDAFFGQDEAIEEAQRAAMEAVLLR